MTSMSPFQWRYERVILLGLILCTWLNLIDSNIISSDCLQSKDSVVDYVWSGALTPSSLQLKVILYSNHSCNAKEIQSNLVVHVKTAQKNANAFSKEFYSTSSDPSSYVYTYDLNELPYPNMTYIYRIYWKSNTSKESSKNPIDQGKANFRTSFNGIFDFSFVMSSCADEDSDPKIFHTMAQHNPLFFLHMGDLHYHDIDKNDINIFREGYTSFFHSPSGRSMLEMNIPISYMWDDHDYGPDNSDGTAIGRKAALATYREYVPHYPLTSNRIQDLSDEYNGAIYQAYTIGSTRFIITDIRSERTPNSFPDTIKKTVLGKEQKEWFKNELKKAFNDSKIQLIFWCNTMPWIDDQRKWGHFTFEQKEIVEYIQNLQQIESKQLSSKKTKLIILSGDAHMIAVDDGSNSPGGLMVFQAAALGREGSIKGGPYSHGVFPGSGQFGLVNVKQIENNICVHFSGRNLLNEIILEYDSCHPEKTPGIKYIPPPKIIRSLQRGIKKAIKYMKSFFQSPSSIILFFIMIGFLLYIFSFYIIKKKSTNRKNKETKMT